MRIRNWKIGTRLGLGFALVLALLASIAGIGVLRLQAVGEATQEMVQRSLVKERLAAHGCSAPAATACAPSRWSRATTRKCRTICRRT